MTDRGRATRAGNRPCCVDVAAAIMIAASGALVIWLLR